MIDLLVEGVRVGTAADVERKDKRFRTIRYLLNGNQDDSDMAVPPAVDKFIFISETCLPVTSLKECELALFGDKSLYSAVVPPPSNDKNVMAQLVPPCGLG